MRWANLLTNQAIAYRKLGRWEEAEGCARRVIPAWEELGNLRSTINALDALVPILRGRGKLVEAEATLRRAFAGLEEMEPGPARDALQAMLSQHGSGAAPHAGTAAP